MKILKFTTILIFICLQSTIVLYSQNDTNRINEVRHWWNSLNKDWRKLLIIGENLSPNPTNKQLLNFSNKTSVRICGYRKGYKDYKIKNLKPLAILKNLKKLECNHLYLKSLEGIGSLQKLKSLDFSHSKIISVKGIENAKNLISLYIPYSDSLISISGIENCTKMDSLVLLCYGKINIQPISKLSELRYLNLGYYTKSLKAISKLKKLEFLNCESIKTLRPIKELYNLKVLNCASNSLRSLKPLKNLHKLEKLNISNSRVRTLRPLRNLTSLRDISIEFTRIRRLGHLCKSKNLERINIGLAHIRLSDGTLKRFIKCHPNCVFYSY